MTELSRIVDGQPLPYSVDQLKRDFPLKEFPSELTQGDLPDSVHIILEVEPPATQDNERAVKALELYAEGVRQSWSVEARPVEAVLFADPYKLRIVLSRAGYREQVEAIVEQAPQEIRDAWEYSVAVGRHSPAVLGIIGVLQLTSAQADKLFADTLDVEV